MSTVQQNLGVTHETDVSPPPLCSILVVFPQRCPLKVLTLAYRPTDAQKLDNVDETLVSSPSLVRPLLDQAVPSYTNDRVTVATVIQNCLDMQEMATRLVLLTSCGADHCAPFHRAASPSRSTATQNVPDEHDTPVNSVVPGSIATGSAQLCPSYMTALPWTSIATQSCNARRHGTDLQRGAP